MTAAAVALLDSNSYLRVGRTIGLPCEHPGLSVFILPILTNECLRSSRLRNKFTWLLDAPHPMRRTQGTLAVNDSDRAEIAAMREPTRDIVEPVLEQRFAHKARPSSGGGVLPVLSPVDLELLCHVLHLGHHLVTDEQPLTAAAKSIHVRVWSSCKLMRKLLEAGAATMDQIEATVRYWQFDKDEPSRGAWRTEYRKLFGTNPPIYP